MVPYIIKRLISLTIVFWGISIIVFTLFQMQPGNPYIYMIDPSVSPETLNAMLKSVGYYDPIYVKYFKWASRAIAGDLGFSIQYKTSVISVINSRIWNTVILSLAASLLSILIAIPTGIFSAVKENTAFDYVATTLSFIGISIPTFFFALLLIKCFAFDLGLLPISGMKTVGEDYSGIKAMIDIGKHMVLPMVVLSFAHMASIMRYVRASMIEVLNEDYMRTARAKGVKERTVILVHGFRNALIPVITILCMQIPFLFSGALITETIFIWPGIGRLNYEAVLNRDYPLIMGILMIVSLVILLSNLLGDILYTVADPRIKIYSKNK